MKILLEPTNSEAAHFFCALHNAPTATETITPTETVAGVTTRTIPAEIITVTEPSTATVAATVYSTSYYTVTTTSAAPTVTYYKRWGDGADLGPLNVLSQFPDSRISSACSCIVPTPPGALSTVTVTAPAVTETVATTVTVPGEEEVTTVTEVTTMTTTTTVQTAVPTYVPAPELIRLCCLERIVVTPGYSYCGYDSLKVGEKVAFGCYEGA